MVKTNADYSYEKPQGRRRMVRKKPRTLIGVYVDAKKQLDTLAKDADESLVEIASRIIAGEYSRWKRKAKR